MGRLGRYAPLGLGILSFAIIVICWQLSIWLKFLNPFFISSPIAIVAAIGEQAASGELFRNLAASLIEFAVGFGLAALAGVLLGLLIGWYKIVDYLLDPFIWFLYSAPLIGFFPVFVIIFGLGKPTVIAVTFLLSIVIIIVNTASGVRDIDPLLNQVARSFGAKRRELFFKIALPASVPMIVAGLRLAVGRALVGVVVAEMFGATEGLGASISYYGSVLKTAEMLASIVVVSGLGVLLTQGLMILEGRFDSWRTEFE